MVRYYLQVRQSEVNRWLKHAVMYSKNSRVATLALKVSKVGLLTTPCGFWFQSLYGRREVGSAQDVCSAEWDHVSVL